MALRMCSLWAPLVLTAGLSPSRSSVHLLPEMVKEMKTHSESTWRNPLSPPCPPKALPKLLSLTKVC